MEATLVAVVTPAAIPTSHKMIQIQAAILAVAAEPTPVAEPMKSKALAVALGVLGMVMVLAKAQVKG